MLPFVASPLFGAMDIFPLPHIYVADNFEFLGYRQVPVASNFTYFHSSILAADNLHNLSRNQTQILAIVYPVPFPLPSFTLVTSALVSQLPCPSMTIHALRQLPAGRCPSCFNYFFLHLFLRLFRSPHLVLSTPGSNLSLIPRSILSRSPSSVDLSVAARDPLFFLVYALLRWPIGLN